MNPIPPHRISLAMLDPLGRPFTIYAASLAELNALNRHYGRNGFRPDIQIPKGGLIFPQALHDTFDFAMIGARPHVFTDGGESSFGVLHGGHFYQQRILEEVDSRKMKLPFCVKYSRGAKKSDPEHIVEVAEGEFKYVTLCQFKGNGKIYPEYQLPNGSLHQLAISTPKKAA